MEHQVIRLSKHHSVTFLSINEEIYVKSIQLTVLDLNYAQKSKLLSYQLLTEF